MTNTYLITVIERVVAFYEVKAANARIAAKSWQDGKFVSRDHDHLVALDAEGPCDVRDRQSDGKWMLLPESQWEAEPQNIVTELLEALRRAEFLMRRVSDGDHRALENLRSAADQASSVIAKATAA
jgi:hypothetical protein